MGEGPEVEEGPGEVTKAVLAAGRWEGPPAAAAAAAAAVAAAGLPAAVLECCGGLRRQERDKVGEAQCVRLVVVLEAGGGAVCGGVGVLRGVAQARERGGGRCGGQGGEARC